MDLTANTVTNTSFKSGKKWPKLSKNMGLKMIGKMKRKIGIKMRRPSDAAPSPSLLRFLASEASRLRQ